MASEEEKTRRKQILHSLREEQRQKSRDRFPESAAVLKKLFNTLDESLQSQDCDDTLRFTREFISKNNLREKEVVAWLEENGGYCDCEVLNNVEQKVSDAVPDYDNL